MQRWFALSVLWGCAGSGDATDETTGDTAPQPDAGALLGTWTLMEFVQDGEVDKDGFGSLMVRLPGRVDASFGFVEGGFGSGVRYNFEMQGNVFRTGNDSYDLTLSGELFELTFRGKKRKASQVASAEDTTCDITLEGDLTCTVDAVTDNRTFPIQMTFSRKIY